MVREEDLRIESLIEKAEQLGEIEEELTPDAAQVRTEKEVRSEVIADPSLL